MLYETERIEFKRQMVQELYKEVIAFANTAGGTIYLGIDDAGNIGGLANRDEAYTAVTNGIRDAILPDVTMFVQYTLQNDGVIRIEVGEGTYKPYYLKGKGLKPSGVFVRQGTSSVPASQEQIRQMIKTSDGDVFEEMRAMQQDLTFDEAAQAFRRYHVDFSPEKYVALGIQKAGGGLFTNLAWLLSDQCRHTVKTAVFADEDNTIFKDSREFTGSVLRQLDETFHYLMLCNNTRAEIKGLERIEEKDYPDTAIREALLNALVHRDYSYSGSTIINVNDTCMEFISLGGLLPGLSPEDIKNGISQPRNRNLAEVFHRLRLIESYGTGLRKIYRAYRNCSVKPEIHVTPNTFKLILPNMYTAAQESESGERSCEHKKAEQQIKITPQMEKVLAYLDRYGEMTDEELQELLDIKRTRSYTLARRMCEENLIDSYGRGKDKVFRKK